MSAMWFLVILVSSLSFVHTFPTGAPNSACVTRMPSHDGALAQTKTCPISIMSYQSGPREVTVILEDSKLKTQFKGFLLGAYHHNGSSITGGSFTTSALTKTLECGTDPQNEVSLTHSSRQLKSKVTTNWRPPQGFQGFVVFHATIVLDYATFWIGIESAPLNVVPSGSINVAPTSEKITKPPTSLPNPTESPIIQFESSKDLYSGCGKSKGCFGLPGDCVGKRKCEVILAYHSIDPKHVHFEMVGTVGSGNGWIAMGLSRNTKMGDDSVTECILMGERVYVRESWNVASPTKDNMILTGVPSNIHDAKGEFENGVVTCRWTRPFVISSNSITFHVDQENFYILLAKGPVDNSGLKLFHSSKLSSANPVNLTAISVVAGKPTTLIKIHGAFMTVAWVGFVSIAILVARHCKEVWMKYKLCGTRVWFSLHRCFMLLSLVLVICGFIAIFIDVDGWSDVTPNPHPILGCVATGLIILQPFIAMCRPQPTSPKRVIFRWIHGLIGNGAQITAWVNMFFAVSLKKSNVPEAFNWVMVTFIIFHCLVHLLIHIHTCFMERERERESNTKLHQFQFGDGYEINEDSPGGAFKKFALSLYSLVTLGLTAALVLMVCLT